MLLLFTACNANRDRNEAYPSLILLDRTHVGDFFCSEGLASQIEGHRIHKIMNRECDPGNGVGKHLYYWTMAYGEDEGRLVELPEAGRGRHHPRDGRIGMMQLILDPEDGNKYFIYNDRTDEYERLPRDERRPRQVYLDRFDGEKLIELFVYSNGEGVLNPITFLADDRSMRIFLPDRTAKNVRRFKLDLNTGEVERLEDLPLPVTGARMYDGLFDGHYLILPLAVRQELYLARIDTRDDSYVINRIDAFESPDGQPPRSIIIEKFEEKGMYVLNYLRPADFSYRPHKGLTGSVVVNAVDAQTLESLKTTVIGGHHDSEAATHYMNGAKFDNQRLAVAYTTVDSVHEWHFGRGKRHENYAESRLEMWRIHDDGSVEKEMARSFDRPFWNTGVRSMGENKLVLSYNTTTETNERWVEIYEYISP